MNKKYPEEGDITDIFEKDGIKYVYYLVKTHEDSEIITMEFETREWIEGDVVTYQIDRELVHMSFKRVMK